MTDNEKNEAIKEIYILKVSFTNFKQFDHPNIIKLHEAFKTKKGKLCIVTEYASGIFMNKKEGDLYRII